MYGFFGGKDGSRAFATGNFKQISDDLNGLTEEEMRKVCVCVVLLNQ
jgi:hypothetical protein